MTAVARTVATTATDAYPRIVAALIRVTHDWTLAEDCAQEAMARALARWPVDGIPDNPAGWLMQVARHHALDILRRATVERRKLRELAVLAIAGRDERSEAAGEDVVDDRLRLIFTCCHPALTVEARVALTLRTICGMPTADIARSFLVSEATMTRRLTRAKAKVAGAGIGYRAPAGAALAKRLPGVLAVLYLLFTSGYNADGRADFADEAIRLARLLAELLPEQSEPAALLALMLLQHSRRDARRDAHGRLVTLDRQDRSRWDHRSIREAVDILGGLPEVPEAGPYGLQASIAACHAGAPTVEGTDWRHIADCYDRLAQLHPTPVVELNRAVAHGYAHRPAEGLALLTRIRDGGALQRYPLLVAAEAELTARAGDPVRAAALFRLAADQSHSGSERRALLVRADEQESMGAGPG